MKKIHFLGIGGSGISGVAKLAERFGYEVTGCDLEGSTAYVKKVFKGHSADHLRGIDILVVSPAVLYQNPSNPELLAGQKMGIVVTWQEFLGKMLSKNKKLICVAGTHGKSTTTAMAGKLLTDAGLDPSVVIGANVPEWGGNYRFGNGEYFVIEADEFNDNFLNYRPEIIILNNIEFDHPDYFNSEEDVFISFSKFVKNLTGRKVLITNGDSLGVKKLLSSINTDEFTVVKYFPENHDQKFKLKIPGKHNIANALGVYQLGKILDIDEGLIKKSLENFSGIGRRLELISSKNDVEIYDDYAHHPTAIRATVEALREDHPNARIWAIDEPHGFSRTHALLSNYKGVFDKADKVIIGPIFKARDLETFGMSPKIIAEKSAHKDIVGTGSFKEIKDILSKEVKKGDIILVMGAGKSYLWAREIAKIIEQ